MENFYQIDYILSRSGIKQNQIVPIGVYQDTYYCYGNTTNATYPGYHNSTGGHYPPQQPPRVPGRNASGSIVLDFMSSIITLLLFTLIF